MQSFKATFKSRSNNDAQAINFAPYLATELTRVYFIHSEPDDLKRIESTLSALPGFCLIGWQMNRNVALKDIIQVRPELIVVYSSCISNLDFALARAIKEEIPTTNLIFVAGESDSKQLQGLMRAGASGYCSASVASHILGLAFQTVAIGGVWIDPTATDIFAATNEDDDESEEVSPPAPSLLSDRETQVLNLVAEGLTNQEIAERLWLSRETVKSHVKKIMRKLAVKDRTQAAVAALRLGLSV